LCSRAPRMERNLWSAMAIGNEEENRSRHCGARRPCECNGGLTEVEGRTQRKRGKLTTPCQEPHRDHGRLAPVARRRGIAVSPARKKQRTAVARPCRLRIDSTSSPAIFRLTRRPARGRISILRSPDANRHPPLPSGRACESPQPSEWLRNERTRRLTKERAMTPPDSSQGLR